MAPPKPKKGNEPSPDYQQWLWRKGYEIKDTNTRATVAQQRLTGAVQRGTGGNSIGSSSAVTRSASNTTTMQPSKQGSSVDKREPFIVNPTAIAPKLSSADDWKVREIIANSLKRSEGYFYEAWADLKTRRDADGGKEDNDFLAAAEHYLYAHHAAKTDFTGSLGSDLFTFGYSIAKKGLSKIGLLQKLRTGSAPVSVPTQLQDDWGYAGSKDAEPDIIKHIEQVRGTDNRLGEENKIYRHGRKPPPHTSRQPKLQKSAVALLLSGVNKINEQIAKSAGDMVGNPVVGRGECVDLIEKLQHNAGAKSYRELQKVNPNNKTQDYRWGSPINQKHIQPGDILQFKKYVLKGTMQNGGWNNLERPNHSAVVLEVHGNGELVVAEQNLTNPDNGVPFLTVRKNTIYLQSGKYKLPDGISEVIVKVSGKVSAYRSEVAPH